jgi:thiol-disulfide isomerase/thioredoxin
MYHVHSIIVVDGKSAYINDNMFLLYSSDYLFVYRWFDRRSTRQCQYRYYLAYVMFAGWCSIILFHLLESSEIVFVNFYADWCRFSQQLKWVYYKLIILSKLFFRPIFAEASEKFKDKPTQAVVWASVDSDRNRKSIYFKYNQS